MHKSDSLPDVRSEKPVEYFIYCRDRPDSAALRSELTEAHWSFMDGYADEMIARGPTLTDDRSAATGSMHIVDLPDAEAARVFAFEEPNYKAGVYGEVLVRRWSNLLGRTMWDFVSDGRADQRFLIIGHGRSAMPERALRDEQHRYLDAHHGIILCGPLYAENGPDWLGSAILAELPSRSHAEALQAAEPYAQAGLYQSVEVHAWRFGGRPSP